VVIVIYASVISSLFARKSYAFYVQDHRLVMAVMRSCCGKLTAYGERSQVSQEHSPATEEKSDSYLRCRV